MMHYRVYDSPVGKLLLTSENGCLTGLWMTQNTPSEGSIEGGCTILDKTRLWLDDYFRGEEWKIDFPLNPEGTVFQKQVWKILLTIPFGVTRTYGDIARELAAALGKEKMSAQAVGGAVGRNPISILIPCHRVVGAQGQLTGYAGGLDKKIWLLTHEGRAVRENRLESGEGRICDM